MQCFTYWGGDRKNKHHKFSKKINNFKKKCVVTPTFYVMKYFKCQAYSSYDQFLVANKISVF